MSASANIFNFGQKDKIIKMIKTIKNRKNWCSKRLADVEMAAKTFSNTDRGYAYTSGRIRELENEKTFLEKLLKDLNTVQKISDFAKNIS